MVVNAGAKGAEVLPSCMTSIEKSAYGFLLYMGMLDIRGFCQGSFEETTDPKIWENQYQLARCAGVVANWLQALAQAASNNFEDFDEIAFWKQHAHFCQRFPEADLEKYRVSFDQRLQAASRRL